MALIAQKTARKHQVIDRYLTIALFHNAGVSFSETTLI